MRRRKSTRRRTSTPDGIDRQLQPPRSRDEPPDDADVELFGHPDGPHLVVDYTDGGFPYGVPYADILASELEDAVRRRVGWALAKRAMERTLRLLAGTDADVEMGRVRLLGEGLTRQGYGAHVEVEGNVALTGSYVALVPSRDADRGWAERLRREAALLAHLRCLELPFRVPRPMAIVEGPILVEELVRGFAVGMRPGKRAYLWPWEILGAVAAQVHHAEPPEWLRGSATRRTHAALASLELERYDDPLVAQARAWIARHLPPDEPSSLLHGDLRGQNVLHADDAPPAVIDWEYAQLGDPAYDLAIITRGSKKPFGVSGGLSRLLEAYRAAGGEVTAQQVRLHEIFLVARWYGEGMRTNDAHAVEMNRRMLLRLLGQSSEPTP